MLVSLEVRTPYLHHELAEFAATVPSAVHTRRARQGRCCGACSPTSLPASDLNASEDRLPRPGRGLAARPAGPGACATRSSTARRSPRAGSTRRRRGAPRRAPRRSPRPQRRALAPARLRPLARPVPGREPVAKPRVLVVTPDFPPRPAASRSCSTASSASRGCSSSRPHVGPDGDAEFDADTRPRRPPGRRAHRPTAGSPCALLNAAALREAPRFRPDVDPQRPRGRQPRRRAPAPEPRVPLVQYVHADEFRARASSPAPPSRRADPTIAVSELHPRAWRSRRAPTRAGSS